MNFDWTILEFIHSGLHCSFLDTAMPVVTQLAVLWGVCAVALFFNPKTRKVGVAMMIALGLEMVCCNVILKPLVGRIRPCNIHAAVPLLISRPSDYSFPSGHTAVAFTGAATLFFSRREIADPKRRKYICLLTAVLAGLIAFSRLYLYVHYPTDVLAGALLGMMMGWMGSKAANLLPEKMEGLLWKHNLQD